MTIRVSGVSRFFGALPAVHKLDLCVPGGSVTGLVGPNGAGKTTLLLMLAALLKPDSGSIEVAGLDPVTQPREVHQAVGWMPDASGTWDSLTCTEILLTFAAAQGLDRPTARERAVQVLSLVHLEEMARTPARVLSRGQKQRLSLARALVHSPQVLLLDEPAVGMDPRSRADLRTTLRDLASQGATVLVSSHILGELEEMVDGVVFMAQGSTVRSPYQAPAGTGHAPQEPGAEAGSPAPGTAADAEPAGDAEATGADVTGTGAGNAEPAGDVEATGAIEPAATAAAADPAVPVPVRRTWRLQALDSDRLSTWARGALPETSPASDGSLRVPVPDDPTAARILRHALEAGVDVVSFAPVTGELEEAYLAMEGERV